MPPPPLVFYDVPPPATTVSSNSATAAAFHRLLPLLVASTARPSPGPGPGGSGKLPPSPAPILLLQGPGGRLRAWESLLPYARPKPIDLTWVRIPLMLVALGVILFWQWQKQSRGFRGGMVGEGMMERGAMFGGGGGGGGGRRRHRWGRYKEEVEDGCEEEEDDEDPTGGIGLRPGGRNGYEARESEEELRFMRAALEEVRRAPGRPSAMEEEEMEEMLRRERSRIERWG